VNVPPLCMHSSASCAARQQLYRPLLQHNVIVSVKVVRDDMLLAIAVAIASAIAPSFFSTNMAAIPTHFTFGHAPNILYNVHAILQFEL
jgi:hypothetical protein